MSVLLESCPTGTPRQEERVSLNSSPLRARIREALEESGLSGIEAVDGQPTAEIFDLDIHPIPQRGSELAHFHYDVRYALRATNGTRFRVSSESRALAWVPIIDLTEPSAASPLTQEASILRMAIKWQTRTCA